MKITTKLKIIPTIVICMTIASAIIIWLLFQEMHQKEIQEENKTSIIMDIFKLDVLMHEYLLHLEERPREQWKIQNNTLFLLLNGISSKNPKDESALKTIRNNQAHITEQFSRIISLHEDPDSNKDVDFFRKINKHLQSRIELGSHNMIRHSVQLHQRSQKDLINIHKRMSWLLISVMLFSGILIAFLTIFISRSIFIPISELSRATEIVGSGNLDFQIASKRKDELGQFSKTFDQMVSRLKSTMILSNALEGEVFKRNAELEEANNQLKAEFEDRRRLHRELERSEKRFRAFMDHTPAAVYIKDKSCKLVYGNQFVLDYVGATEDQFLGTTSHDHFPPDIANIHEEADRKVLDEGMAVEGEPWKVEIGGETRWWYDVKFPVKLEIQEYMVGGISFDITDLKRAEQTLNERLRFEKLISELSGTFINLPFDQIDQKIDYGLELIAKQLDIERIALLQFSRDKSQLNLTHTYAIDSRQRAPIFLVSEQLPWFSESLRRGKTLRISKIGEMPEEAVAERQYMKRQGFKSFLNIPMIINESVIGAISYSDMQQEREWSGQLISQLGIITEMFANALKQKETEKELHESEERYRALVNESPAAILVFQDGHFLFSNPAGLRLLGFSELKDIVDRPVLDVVSPAFHEPVIQQMESLAQGKSNPTVEIELLKTGGTIVAVETTSVPIQIGGKPAGLVICNDITKRKQAEEAILKSREDFRYLAGKLLSVQESERRRLAREMHDDLTQRLAVLAIDIGKMERKFQDSEDPVLETLRSVRERLVNLSGDVHAISRQLHPSILEDLGLVDAIKSECTSFTRREGISVDYQAENIPLRITKDVAISIYRIVQEGLRNVAKHAGTTQLQVSLTGMDDSIFLTIKDQGAGFDLKEAEKKLGLGLVSMQERVRLIQGNISIESRPGKGTVIKVRAPVGP